MKKIVLLLAICLMPGLAWANKFVTLTVDDTAAGTTLSMSAVGGDYTCVCGPLEGGQIRFRVDGTAPTTTVGHILEVGQTVCIGEKCANSGPKAEPSNFKGIRTGATSGTLPCQCY